MNAFISVLDYTPCFLDHMTFYIIFPPFEEPISRSSLRAYSQGKILWPLSISKYECVYSMLTFYLFFNWLLAFSVAPKKLYAIWGPNSSFQKLMDFTLPHFILYQTFS